MLNVTSEGFVYEWVPDPTSTALNPLKRGSWVKTLGGFQICDVDGFTYLVSNGFRVEDLPCGFHQVRVTPDFPVTPDTTMWLSELVDIRDFDADNNRYHKLIICHWIVTGKQGNPE